MCRADDFDRDAKGGEPSEELGAHCDIDMGKKVLIIHRHDHYVLAEAVNNDADKVAASIVGIGINLNQTEFDPALPNPTSLALQCGASFDVKEELERFAAHFADACMLMNSLDGRNALAEEFSESMFYLEKDRQDALDAAIARYESML